MTKRRHLETIIDPKLESRICVFHNWKHETGKVPYVSGGHVLTV